MIGVSYSMPRAPSQVAQLDVAVILYAATSTPPPVTIYHTIDLSSGLLLSSLPVYMGGTLLLIYLHRFSITIQTY